MNVSLIFHILETCIKEFFTTKLIRDDNGSSFVTHMTQVTQQVSDS